MSAGEKARRLARCAMIVVCAALAVTCAVYLASRPEPRDVVSFKKEYKTPFSCYRDGELLWTVEFSDGYAEGGSYTSNGAAVWGRGDVTLENHSWRPWLARVDDRGNVLWRKWIKHGFEDEYIVDVVEDADGSWAVISRGDGNYLCLSRYDKDGNFLYIRKNFRGNEGIWDAARLGDGYLVRISTPLERDTARVAELNRHGRVVGEFTVEGDGSRYYTLVDMIEFEGKAYLSAYATPELYEWEPFHGAQAETIRILDEIHHRDSWEIPDEELTELVRKNYTAVLFVYDPTDGSREMVHSVDESLGGSLAVNRRGELEWNTERAVTTRYSPMTSAFSIAGECEVTRYTFDIDGVQIGRENTGERTIYLR